MELVATQPSTQLHWDNRRSAAYSSPEYDDVICILHPSSASAVAITRSLWEVTPEHILQYKKRGLTAEGQDEDDGLEMELEPQSFQPPEPPANLDIALRTTANLKNIQMGFVFGRDLQKTDIQFRSPEEDFHRVSNMHFRIYINESGILMLQDLSTNGTWVDDFHLKGNQLRRMLNHGSMIHVVTGGNRTTATLDKIRFIVKLPQRKDDSQYKKNLREFLLEVQEAKQATHPQGKTLVKPPDPAGRGNSDLLTAGTARFSWNLGWDDNGKYNPIGEIGKGAFATVYKVATAEQGDIFAAKRIDKAAFMKNGVVDAKFDNELNIMKRLSHPHIVAFHDWHLDIHHLFIIMEFVPCGDMAPYTRKENHLDEPVLRSVTKQVLHALDYIHTNGVVHRDIKPENLLVYSKEPFVVKLADFGLSKMIDGNDKGGMVTFCGTLLYCAPEVYPEYENMRVGMPKGNYSRHKANPYSSAVDIWSFGTVLYHFIASKAPYKGSAENHGYNMLHSILHDFLDYDPISPPNILASGHNLLCNMLAVVAGVRPSAKEALRFDWVKEMDDVIPVPELRRVERPEDVNLGTVNEEDGHAGWSDFEEEGFDADSFRRAAKGLLPDAAPEVPGLVHDSTSTDDRVVEIQENVEPLQTNQAESVTDEKQSTLEPVAEPAAVRSSPFVQRDLDQHDMGPKVTTESIDSNSPKDILTALESLEGFFASDGDADSENSNYGRPSESKVSVLEGYNAADVKPRNPPGLHRGTANLGTKDRPTERPLFGEITTQAGLVGESGVFGSGPQPLIRRDVSTTPDSELSGSSTSLGWAEQKMDNLNVQTPKDGPNVQASRALIDPLSTSRTMSAPTLSMSRGKRTRLAEVTNADDLEAASEGEPAAKKSMTAAHRKTLSERGAASTDPEEDVSHSMSQGMIALRLHAQASTAYGILTPVEGSFSVIPIVLTARLTTWGRSADDVNTPFPSPENTRVPKLGMDIYFWARNPTGSSSDWKTLPNLYANLMTRSRQGIKVNGVKLYKSPERGPFRVGKLKTGDVIEIYRDQHSFLQYTCSFNIGESEKEREDGETFVVEDNPELYAEAVCGPTPTAQQVEEGAFVKF